MDNPEVTLRPRAAAPPSPYNPLGALLLWLHPIYAAGFLAAGAGVAYYYRKSRRNAGWGGTALAGAGGAAGSSLVAWGALQIYSIPRRRRQAEMLALEKERQA